MAHLPNVLFLIGRLLNYPEPGTIQLAERLCAELRDELSLAAPSAREFLLFSRQHDSRDIEEVFTRSFDINPACALEVGWHLFGEEYIRGLFLVRMREELRKYDLPETVELPDHIAHVLSVAAAMPADEATRFVCACVLPAVKKMNQALADKETPYRHILHCLESVLTIQWGTALEAASKASQTVTTPRLGKEDPLRAFPISDVAGDCEACSHVSIDAVPQHVIPRESEFPDIRGRDDYREPDHSAVAVAAREHPTSPSPLATDRRRIAYSNPSEETVSENFFDQFLFVALPYVCLFTFFLMTVYRYRMQSFSYSSLSSQFLENEHHFWSVVPFHYGILVVALGHLIAFLIPRGILAWNRHPLRLYILEISALAFGLLTVIGLISILVRRVSDNKIRRVTTPTDWILLLMLVTQAVSGVCVAVFYPWGSSWFASHLAPYLWSIFLLLARCQLRHRHAAAGQVPHCAGVRDHRLLPVHTVSTRAGCSQSLLMAKTASSPLVWAALKVLPVDRARTWATTD